MHLFVVSYAISKSFPVSVFLFVLQWSGWLEKKTAVAFLDFYSKPLEKFPSACSESLRTFLRLWQEALGEIFQRPALNVSIDIDKSSGNQMEEKCSLSGLNVLVDVDKSFNQMQSVCDWNQMQSDYFWFSWLELALKKHSFIRSCVFQVCFLVQIRY